MVFDDTHPSFNDSIFKHGDWSALYSETAEPIPANSPVARGNPASKACFAYADHTGYKMTRGPHTGTLIFVNRAPIFLFLKRQNTVESSTFSSEFIAMKQSVELIEALRYKLRMMGFPMEGKMTILFCDNSTVLVKTTSP